jgi:hypothetical protein
MVSKLQLKLLYNRFCSPRKAPSETGLPAPSRIPPSPSSHPQLERNTMSNYNGSSSLVAPTHPRKQNLKRNYRSHNRPLRESPRYRAHVRSNGNQVSNAEPALAQDDTPVDRLRKPGLRSWLLTHERRVWKGMSRRMTVFLGKGTSVHRFSAMKTR